VGLEGLEGGRGGGGEEKGLRNARFRRVLPLSSSPFLLFLSSSCFSLSPPASVASLRSCVNVRAPCRRSFWGDAG
jgi:hypothetical protein